MPLSDDCVTVFGFSFPKGDILTRQEDGKHMDQAKKTQRFKIALPLKVKPKFRCNVLSLLK